MKHCFLPTWAVVAAALLTSCGKDHPATPQPDAFPSYLPLQTGNYWVYQRYAIDGATGQATATNVLDSCFISKDTLIHGQKYYKLVRPYVVVGIFNDNLYLRDSLHYIVDQHGRRQFSSQDFNSVFVRDFIVTYPVGGRPDTICEIKRQMVPGPATTVTRAGSFQTLETRENFRFYPPWTQMSVARQRHTTFAQQVGIVTETLPFYLSDPNYLERRLLRYRVQ